MLQITKKWKTGFLYIVLVPDVTFGGWKVSEFGKKLDLLTEKLTNELPGVTEVKLKGKGITRLYGKEDTYLLTAIVEHRDVTKTKRLFEQIAVWMLGLLDQKEILIITREIDFLQVINQTKRK